MLKEKYLNLQLVVLVLDIVVLISHLIYTIYSTPLIYSTRKIKLRYLYILAIDIIVSSYSFLLARLLYIFLSLRLNSLKSLSLNSKGPSSSDKLYTLDYSISSKSVLILKGVLLIRLIVL